MTTTTEEVSEKCPNCGMGIFEAVENGRCVYCGEEIPMEVLSAPCGYTGVQQEEIDQHESTCPKCKKIRASNKIFGEGNQG